MTAKISYDLLWYAGLEVTLKRDITRHFVYDTHQRNKILLFCITNPLLVYFFLFLLIKRASKNREVLIGGAFKWILKQIDQAEYIISMMVTFDAELWKPHLHSQLPKYCAVLKQSAEPWYTIRTSKQPDQDGAMESWRPFPWKPALRYQEGEYEEGPAVPSVYSRWHSDMSALRFMASHRIDGGISEPVLLNQHAGSNRSQSTGKYNLIKTFLIVKIWPCSRSVLWLADAQCWTAWKS